MKAIVFIFKAVTLPIWLPLWVIFKLWKVVLLAVVVSAASGCVTNTGKIDKSPCACQFTPFVTADQERSNV
ncbi:hypothetical protein K5E40_27830 [Pseudomonas baetica]|jgi:hypothetical protein|uniref:hypothetical protein n=1 Tax=Pseudomonas TaxID=286 RepID=UPI001C8B6BB3|nr:MULTISPECIES: hypothetical protein [Pseudomonas]MBX9409472.1 hypothetical protein [Pseudomonas baetica]CAH0273624.1 hypothetical protein SRABI111_03748 [Pseudomonas carnis]CAH0323766.1 hypothetical protein SRABI08_05682 [Pseudomonas carnis]CAH0324699.1 hypothetical protein SRABI110_06020 [Pseudomonas carnis]CAH0325821.1 hypothetical protein SRABI64_06044 [Pseudomonas carnis]